MGRHHVQCQREWDLGSANWAKLGIRSRGWFVQAMSKHIVSGVLDRDGSLRIDDSCNPDFAPLYPPFVSRSALNGAKMVHVGPMLKNCQVLEVIAVLLVPRGDFAVNRFVICKRARTFFVSPDAPMHLYFLFAIAFL